MSESIAISLDEMSREPGRYLQQAASGVEITVLLHGEPMARIVPPGREEIAGIPALIREAQALRAGIPRGQSASDLLAEARRDAGRS